jgi:pyruvate,water dikinase
MCRFFFFIKEKFFKKKKIEPVNVEALRLDFKERYHNFKLLLNANNKSLEIMADIEKTLREGLPFGMSFVKANCTAVSVNVFRMIRKLDKLAPEKYKDLHDRFKVIQGEINRLLTRKPLFEDKRQVIPLCDIRMDMADMVGSKMANIGEMKNRINIRVPNGFVITAFAYECFLQHNDLQAEIDRLIQSTPPDNMEALYTLCAEIQQMIIRAEMPPDSKEAVNNAIKKLESETDRKITLALRSSALGEDSAESSFAGQYRSILNVSIENIFQAYKEVVASKYSLPALTYRLNRGFRDEDIAMCVGCLNMLDAISGGVAYSHNPMEIRDDSIFINAAWGLPKSVVDGSVACDLFVVSRKPSLEVTHKEIQEKEKKFVCYPEEGVCRMDIVGDTRSTPSLTGEQILELAELAVKIESYYGSPQDIEWALTSESPSEFYILQCRPLQQKHRSEKAFPSALKIDPEMIIAKGGIAASPGVAYGEAYLAERGVDILNFPKGGVLVTRQALPIWAPLLDRSAAVITEQGGFAGHLANVAREFEVPALFGVKDITEKIKPGEIITVDAEGLAIYRGKVEKLLTMTGKKKNMMENSPVYETLKQAGSHIVPLNLLDPDAPEFSPVNCMTFHDITRFIHEKSVQEMFNFGKEHNFLERSGKQLYYHVPMQWWILNLDDGFREEVTGKYVRLDNIISIPMLALWEGIVAIPWDGPPPIDGRGFMSVMYQATANTALNTGTRSRYSERNYFMISKYYCSLSSRLGFHFTILEALVSERSAENYISFRFQGGAADYNRRIKRIQFVGELLSEYGFAINIKEDNLTARMEGHESEFMKERLKIIGYLTIHTRQLDMVMSRPATVSRYRLKFKKDIESMIYSEAFLNLKKKEDAEK